MPLRFFETTAGELTREEKRRCYSLTLRERGSIRKWLPYDNAKVVLVKDGDLLVGWGIRKNNSDSGYYVRQTHRRQGIGTKIYYLLNQPGDKVRVTPWDEASAGFFYALGKTSKAEVKRRGLNPDHINKKPRQDTGVS